MNKLRFAMLTALCLAVVNQVRAEEEGWTSLFNGKDLSGWRINEHPESFSVQNGELVLFGPRGHAFYVGEDGKATFKNFHLKAEVKTTKGSNSGIYFHTKFLKSGWPNRGYEAQVNNTHSDPKKTGGLYSVQDNYEAPAQDDEWFEYEIMVQGKHIVIKINGETISDYTEPEDLNRPNRQLGEGTFALQAHDPASKVFYRNIKVKVLDE